MHFCKDHPIRQPGRKAKVNAMNVLCVYNPNKPNPILYMLVWVLICNAPVQLYDIFVHMQLSAPSP